MLNTSLSRLNVSKHFAYLLAVVQSNVKLNGTHHTFIIQRMYFFLSYQSERERGKEIVSVVLYLPYAFYRFMWVKLNTIGKGVESFVYQNRKVTLWRWDGKRKREREQVQWVIVATKTHSTQALCNAVSGRKLTTLCLTFYNIRIVFAFSVERPIPFLRVPPICFVSLSLFFIFPLFWLLPCKLTVASVLRNFPVIIKHTKCCGKDSTVDGWNPDETAERLNTECSIFTFCLATVSFHLITLNILLVTK